MGHRWQEVRITLNRAALEGANAVLDRWGITNYAVEDTALFDRARELGWGDYVPEQEVSAQVAVICYFTEELSADKLEKLKAELFGLADFGFDPGPVEISAAYVDEEDWAQAWKEHYHPFRIGQVAVQPSWVPEEKQKSEKVVVRLDPGMAFGSGTHPTTALCIEILQQLNLEKRLVWDVGTGSGILAVVAAKLGAKVQAVDLDPVAVRVAAENRDLNGLDFPVFLGSLRDLTGRPAIIVANIVADVILDMLPRVHALLAPGGFFIASGVIETRDTEIIQQAKKANLRLLRRFQRGEWVAYLLQRGEETG